jgi:hypothetical protein
VSAVLGDLVAPVFFFSLGLTVVCWLLMVFELIATAQFNPTVYRLGPVVVRGRITLDRSRFSESAFNVADSRALVDHNGVLMLRPRFGLFAFNTPLPIKGRLIPTEAAGEMALEGRLPISSILFAISWVLASISLGILLGSAGRVRAGVTFCLAGLMIVLVLSVVSWFVELRRVRIAVQALKGI